MSVSPQGNAGVEGETRGNCGMKTTGVWMCSNNNRKIIIAV